MVEPCDFWWRIDRRFIIQHEIIVDGGHSFPVLLVVSMRVFGGCGAVGTSAPG